MVAPHHISESYFIYINPDAARLNRCFRDCLMMRGSSADYRIPPASPWTEIGYAARTLFNRADPAIHGFDCLEPMFSSMRFDAFRG